MTLTGFIRASKLGLTNYVRNYWLSLAATLVVTYGATLMLLVPLVTV